MNFDLSRREFLQISTAAGYAAFIDPRIIRDFTPEDRSTLLATIRLLFPHPNEKDSTYIRAVDSIEGRCRADTVAFWVITAGIKTLNRAFLGRFAAARVETRIKALKSSRGSAFFHIIYGESLESLYGSPEMWDMFNA